MLRGDAHNPPDGHIVLYDGGESFAAFVVIDYISVFGKNYLLMKCWFSNPTARYLYISDGAGVGTPGVSTGYSVLRRICSDDSRVPVQVRVRVRDILLDSVVLVQRTVRWRLGED